MKHLKRRGGGQTHEVVWYVKAEIGPRIMVQCSSRLPGSPTEKSFPRARGRCFREEGTRGSKAPGSRREGVLGRVVQDRG